MAEFIQVVTTTATQDDAQAIADALLARRLAACVQVGGPITSTYRWQGKVETATEWQCVAKTRLELYPVVEAAIRDLHPYETPEILALPVLAGYEKYLAWVQQEATGPDG